jgi:hypothetical protein
LPPEDESLSKYVSPKYMKKINTEPRMAKPSTGKSYINPSGLEKALKANGDIKLREDSPSRTRVKFDEK